MSLTPDQIAAEALKLPEESRIKLFERLLFSFDESFQADPAAAKAWLEEAEQRDQAMNEGREEAIPAEEVFRRLRSSLR